MKPEITRLAWVLAPAASPVWAAADPVAAAGMPVWLWAVAGVLAVVLVLLGVLLLSPAPRRPGGGEEHESRVGEQAGAALRRAASTDRVNRPYMGRRVLVAEDNLTSQLVLKRLLEHLGLEVDIAPNGRRAVELCRDHEYAAVLMDIRMPVMDGLSATRQIRDTQKGRNLPVIGVTADTLRIDQGVCLEAGMDDYIEKPVRRLALIRVLARWIEVPVLADSGQGIASAVVEDGAFEARFLARLREQVTELAPHTVRLVGDSYLAETRRLLDRINHAMSQRDQGPIFSGLSRLKASSLDVGADTMADMADAMVATLERSAMGEAGQILRRMWGEFERLEHVLGRLAAAEEDGDHSRLA